MALIKEKSQSGLKCGESKVLRELVLCIFLVCLGLQAWLHIQVVLLDVSLQLVLPCFSQCKKNPKKTTKKIKQVKAVGRKCTVLLSGPEGSEVAQPSCIWKANVGEEEAVVVYLRASGAEYSLGGALSKMSFTSLTRPDRRGLSDQCCHTSH